MGLIDRAIKEIENEFAEVLTSHGYDSYEKADLFYQWYCDGLMKAIGILLDMEEEQPRWIPCSERLPEEENKSYWICTDGGYQCECRWTNVNHLWTNLTTDWHWHIMDVPQYSKVIAWIPLPEPYEEVEQ